MPATKTHSACTIHEGGMRLPRWLGYKKKQKQQQQKNNDHMRKNLTQNGEPQRYSWGTQKKKKKKKTKKKEEEEEEKKKETREPANNGSGGVSCFSLIRAEYLNKDGANKRLFTAKKSSGLPMTQGNQLCSRVSDDALNFCIPFRARSLVRPSSHDCDIKRPKPEEQERRRTSKQLIYGS